jgi:hypothetical protein
MRQRRYWATSERCSRVDHSPELTNDLLFMEVNDLTCPPRVRAPPVTAFTAPVIVDSNPRKGKGATCENMSQPRRLAIEAAIRLCPSPGSGHHEKALAPAPHK